MKTAINKIFSPIVKKYEAFSARERKMILLGTFAVFFVIFVKGVKVSKAGLEEQEMEFQKTKADLSLASGLLKSYQKLKLKRDDIEKYYEKLEFNEGALSYLDALIKQKLGDAVKQNFNITPRPPQPFGLTFELNPFSIKFTVPSLEKLTEFLKEAVSGANPMFITKLDMTKNYRGDGLDVEVELSCIQKAGTTKS